MDNNYLIPANSKKSMLDFGLFNRTDEIILAVCLGITLLLIMIVPLQNTLAVVLAVLPGMVGCFLVFPIPNYHNVRTFIKSVYVYFKKDNNYVWKGWCLEDGDNKK